MHQQQPSSSSDQSIPYRSIAEMRIANEVLSKEGQWDDARKGFRTKECQLQERSRHFHHLHQVLRYTPAEAYENQGRDTDYRYPLCLREMIKKKPTGSDGIEDPSGPQIDQRKVIAAQNKMRQERSVSKQLREVEVILRKAASETLSSSTERRESLNKDTSVVGHTPLTGGLDISAVQASPASPQQSRLGTISRDSPSPSGMNTSSASANGRKQQYSSVLVQMKRTKQDAERTAREFTAVRTILEMPATPQLKGTITKMFAHPDAAEELSQQEHDRREREFEEERLSNLRYQDTMLQEERLVIEREMKQVRGAGRR